MSRLTAALVIVVACRASAAAADPGPFARFLGGGSVRTDCMLVVDVAGVSGGGRARATRCTDGDTACDVDGAAGQCVFRLRLCLDTDAAPACRADVVTAAAVASAAPALTGLADALHAVTMPVSVPETCTAAVDVAVPTRGRRPGRLVLPTTAATASGHTDRDRLTLVCRPSPTAANGKTFASVQRIFDRSCASVSCHGEALAGGLGLTAGESYGRLVNAPASNLAAAAAGVIRVIPGDPDASFLLRKLTGQLAADEGARMPQVGNALPAAQIDLVRRWIAAGAPIAAPF